MCTVQVLHQSTAGCSKYRPRILITHQDVFTEALTFPSEAAPLLLGRDDEVVRGNQLPITGPSGDLNSLCHDLCLWQPLLMFLFLSPKTYFSGSLVDHCPPPERVCSWHKGEGCQSWAESKRYINSKESGSFSDVSPRRDAAVTFNRDLRTAGNLIYHMLSTVQQMDDGVLVFSVLSLHLSIQALGKRLVSRLRTHGCSLRAWLFHQCAIAGRTENPFSVHANAASDLKMGLLRLSPSCQKVNHALKNRLARANQLVQECYGLSHVKHLLKETSEQGKNPLTGSEDG